MVSAAYLTFSSRAGDSQSTLLSFNATDITVNYNPPFFSTFPPSHLPFLQYIYIFSFLILHWHCPRQQSFEEKYAKLLYDLPFFA